MSLINIVFSIDCNFERQLAVTITSILSNSDKHDEFSFYVLDGGISKSGKQKILELKSIKNFKINYIPISEKDFKDFPISYHFSAANYYRMKLPSLLNLEKVLYLDCDIIVRKSLKDFYNIELNEKYAAVVEDIIYEKDLQDRGNVLGVSKYFNSGVMLLNLKKMREDKIQDKCFEFANSSPEKIKWVDQCVFNAIFAENVIFLDKIYNFQYNLELCRKNRDCIYFKKNIFILHFAGLIKPWQFKSFNLCLFEYIYYWIKTPYRNELIDIFFANLNKFIYTIFFKKSILTFRYIIKSIWEG